jgi:flagellar biosynthesis protein FlhG
MSRQGHYESLGLSRDATAEQVEKAYHFFASMYDEEALATYSLLDVEEQRAARARVRQAYEVLRDPVQRQLYDRALAEASAGQAEPARPAPAEAVPPPVERRPAELPAPASRFLPEPVTGESLRRAREERRISLREIATVTKIGVRFLEYIEADRHGDLPAPVYIRGFVHEYARCLGLDPKSTADAYLRRVRSPT